MSHYRISLLTILFSASLFSVHAQESYSISERLILDFPLIDAPYLKHAAEMSYNKRRHQLAGGEVSPTLGDYLHGYESPSMTQALAVTKDLHTTGYYFTNKLWNKWLEPKDRKSLILNRLAANATAAGVDLLLAYKLMVFSPVWNHEEFHRNGLTLQGISSYDDTYYRFTGKDIPSGSVTKVMDEDLARFKEKKPQAFVRSFASGIESQYQFVRNLQKDNFFLDTDYPNMAMNILITKQAVDYVNQFRQKGYDQSIDTMNYYGDTEKERDFVGWDFTPWVYDLFRPNEPYADRGIHPSGVGINRVIKRSQLTKAEDAYLTKMGRLQYLNFVTPFMIGINRIRINEDNAFNFALRHYPTSFGYNLNADFFLDTHGKKWLIGLHSYHNEAHSYPGAELTHILETVSLRSGKQIPIQIRSMAWVQPKDESFYATKGKPGGLVQAKAYYPVHKGLSVYGDVEAKSKGWVAGNPFLGSNLSVRAGVTIDIQ